MFVQLLTAPALQTSSGTPPVITSPTPGQIVDYAEDDGGAVATVVYSGSPNPTLSLSGPDAALFDLSGDDIVWLAAPDYEDPQGASGNTYHLTVTATNSEDAFAVSFFVRVTNVVDVAPTITFPTSEPVQVPSGRRTAFTARSSDDAASRTWAIDGGADAALFSVVASTGLVRFLAAPDYDDPQDDDTDNDYELTISVTTSVDTDTQAVVVRVVEGGDGGRVVRKVKQTVRPRLRGL